MGRTYGGVSAAQRQEDRREQLLAAGLEVLATEGWPGATVRAICREAELTSRFFYESFESVEELASELFDRALATANEAVVAAVGNASRDPHERNRVAIETFVRELTADPRIGRLVFVEALGNDVLARRRRTALGAIAEALLAGKGRSRRPPGASATYRHTVATVLVGGLAELLVAWMNGDVDAGLAQLVDDYVRLANDVGDRTWQPRS